MPHPNAGVKPRETTTELRSFSSRVRFGIDEPPWCKRFGPVDLATAERTPKQNQLVVIEKVNKFYGDLHVLNDITTTIARG